MKPGSVFELPKPDKRYKPGKIAKDKKGKYRGNPETVELRPVGLSMNPPLLVSESMAKWLKEQGITA